MTNLYTQSYFTRHCLNVPCEFTPLLNLRCLSFPDLRPLVSCYLLD